MLKNVYPKQDKSIIIAFIKNDDEIKTLIASEELRTLEIKKTMGELKDGMHSLCVMLNSDGGYVIFGMALLAYIEKELIAFQFWDAVTIIHTLRQTSHKELELDYATIFS